jgi:hypothetical protein
VAYPDAARARLPYRGLMSLRALRIGAEPVCVHAADGLDVVHLVIELRHLDHRLTLEPGPQRLEVRLVPLGEPAVVSEAVPRLPGQVGTGGRIDDH